MFALLLGLVLGSFCLLIYGVYLSAIYKGKKYLPPDELQNFVPLSVIIPARNEEEIIEEKLKNLAEADYPKELFQVIIIDDASTDKTAQIAQAGLKKYQLRGEIIANSAQKGTNYSYNQGMKHATNEIVIATDADAMLEKTAIKKLVGVLQNDTEVGAVCGELVPVSRKGNLSAAVEKPYRQVFGKICAWESNLYSTYCFNGPLIALRKKAYAEMNPERGASDTNIALGVINRGYQAKYVATAKFYELIPASLAQQRRQKIRRAARLLESTWAARAMLFKMRYKKFGSVVLPLRFAMLFFVPIFSFLMVGLGAIYFFQRGITDGWLYLVVILGLVFLGKVKPNFLTSFMVHQYYLLSGLLHILKPMPTWDSIERR